MIYLAFWLMSVLLAGRAGYRLGWKEAKYAWRAFAGIDRKYLSPRARGFVE